MTDLPEFLVQGERARLFPVGSEGGRERRLTSLFLSVITQIPELANKLFAGVGPRFGARTRAEAFTEIVFKSQPENLDRPDGFLSINTSQRKWHALVEAKIGNADLDQKQVERYLELARTNGVDAVITISNQFVSRPDHSPVTVRKQLTNRVNLIHWSWVSVLTQCQVLQLSGEVDDAEQIFLLNEFIRHLEHPSTGVERFNQMNKSWRDVVSSVANGETLRKIAPEVEETVGAWVEEERDLSLLLSRSIGEHVVIAIERKLRDDPKERAKRIAQEFANTQTLASSFRIPDAADSLAVEADVARKTVCVSMTVKAPQDRKSTKARVNWLLKMLKDDDPNLQIRALWPGRTPPSQASVQSLRQDPTVLGHGSTAGSTPHGFQVCLIEDLGRRFSGSRTFIEDLERIVPQFYAIAGQHLRAWQPAPPKPVKAEDDDGDLAD